MPGADGAMLIDDTQKAELLRSYLPFTFSTKAFQTEQHRAKIFKRELEHKSVEEIVREPLVDLNDFISCQ